LYLPLRNLDTMENDGRKERCNSTRKSISFKLPMPQSEHQQPLKKAGYATRQYHSYSDAEFRTKLGFPIKAGVLPTKPLQTASAAAPLSHRAPTLKKKPVEIPATLSLQAVREHEPRTPRDLPPVRSEEASAQHALARADNTAGEKALPSMRRMRMREKLMPFQSGLFAGFVTAMIAIGFGAFWWIGGPGNTALVQLTSPSQLSPAVKTPLPSPFGTTSKQQDYQAAAAGSTQAGRIKSIASTDGYKRMDQSQTKPASEPQASMIADASAVPAAEPRSATAGTSTASKNRADKEPNRSAQQRTVTTSGKERADGTSPVSAKTASAARKSRVSIAKTPQKSAPAKRLAAKATSKSTSRSAHRLAQKTGNANEFKQCRRQPSFFQQEKCKWKICAGKWGKDGCPAYNHDVARY
jgi:hypothetical protein